MAKSQIMQEKFKESIPYLDKAIEVYPEEPQAGELRGVVASKLGNKQSAIDFFYACAKRAPHNPMTAGRIAVFEMMG
jgi:Flp pilus assembly protein TadD